MRFSTRAWASPTRWPARSASARATSTPGSSGPPGGCSDGGRHVTIAPAPPAAGHVDTPPAAGDYAGLATRMLAIAVDAAVIDGVVLFVGLIVGLGLSLFDIPEAVRTVMVAIGACLAFVWTVAYFTFFWSATGQTPGNRVMRIR